MVVVWPGHTAERCRWKRRGDASHHEVQALQKCLDGQRPEEERASLQVSISREHAA